MSAAQFRGPLPVYLGLAVAGVFDHGAQGFGRRGQDLDSAAPVVTHLRRRVADADEFCVFEYRRRSVGELEVETAAYGEDYVGIAHNRTAHGADDGRMAVRHQPTAFAGIEIDRAESVEQRDQFWSGAAGAATGNHQHAAGRPQEVNGLLNVDRIRTRDGAWLCREMLLQLQCLRHNAPQRISRKVDVRRTRFSAFAKGARDRFIEFL